MARSDVLRRALVLLIIYGTFLVRKPSFQKPDGISLTLHRCDMFREDETFIYSSLFCYRRNFPALQCSKRSIFTLLLLMCGDIETCPGPDRMQKVCKNRGFKIFHQNIRGLFANFSSLLVVFETHREIDILTLSETHIVQDSYTDNESLYTIPGYIFIKKNRPQGKGGGVAAYIKSEIVWKERYDLENDDIESIWLEVFPNKAKSFLICCMYRPPENSKYLSSNFNKTFSNMLMTVTELQKEVILLGDLNVNFLKKNDNPDIKDTINLFGFKQVITQPTRITDISSTLIDVIITNKVSNISTTDVIPLSLSDHDMVGCVRKLNHQTFDHKTIHCRNYSKYNHNNLRQDLLTQSWDRFYEIEDVNTALEYFTSVLIRLFDKHAPPIQKKVKGQPCPWLPNDLKKHMNARDKLLRKARKTNMEIDWSNYKSKKNMCNNAIKSARSTYHKNLINENANDPRSFWKCIKQVIPNKSKGNSSSVPFIKDNNINNNIEHKSKADIFCSFFTTIANNLKGKCLRLRNCAWFKPNKQGIRTTAKFKFQIISSSWVERELRSLKRSKTTGPDNLPPGLLKDCGDAISNQLCHLINLTLQTGVVPNEWKIAKVIPVFKSGDRTDPNNYRPISVLPVLSKILEKAVHSQLMDHLEKFNLIANCQYGYRRNRSTEIAATLLLDDIRKNVDKGDLVGAVFIDLTKAFDTIGHGLLLSKLPSYGISNTELTWLTDYLFARQQFVSYDNKTSCKQSVVCGVPQGSVLGPLLFLLCFNDFHTCLRYAKVIKFADDTVIYFSSNDFHVIENRLNDDMQSIFEFLTMNELILNAKKGKTEVMLFGTAKRLSKVDRSLNITYNQQILNQTTTYKYLGTTVDPVLNLNDNFNKSYKKASSRLRLLERLQCYLTPDSCKSVYNLMIIPLITYNCIVNLNLTRTQNDKLSSLDRRASQILGIKTCSLKNKIDGHAVHLVWKSIKGQVCPSFENYFTLLEHARTTRNNGKLMRIPKVRLEFARSGFFFMGARIFNSLPMAVRETFESNFRNNVSEFFKN